MTKLALGLLLCLVGCGTADVQMGTYVVTSWIHPVPSGTTFTIAPTPSGGIEVTSDADLFLVDMANIPPDGANYASLTFTGVATSCEAGPYKTCNFTRREVIVSAASETRVLVDQCVESRTDWAASCSATPSCSEEQAAQAMASACQRFDRLAGTLVQ
jgi:hypothetical protein